MIHNHIELLRDDLPKVLITWHLPREDGLFYPVAFQFSEDIDDETKRQIFEISKRSLKVPAKQNKLARCGSSDHFGVLDRPLSRLGFRARRFGAIEGHHALEDRPIEAPEVDFAV